jgi:hypothetical protein
MTRKGGSKEKIRGKSGIGSKSKQEVHSGEYIMGRFSVTADDLAKGKLVTPGWHPVEIIDVRDEQDKTENPANLTKIQGRVIGGKDEDKGAILGTQFSEKAPAFVKDFVEAKYGKGSFKPDTPVDITNGNFRGFKMMWYVERDTWKGRPKNNVVGYKPLETT